MLGQVAVEQRLTERQRHQPCPERGVENRPLVDADGQGTERRDERGEHEGAAQPQEKVDHPLQRARAFQPQGGEEEGAGQEEDDRQPAQLRRQRRLPGDEPRKLAKSQRKHAHPDQGEQRQEGRGSIEAKVRSSDGDIERPEPERRHQQKDRGVDARL
jgi:hypothetical protein